MHKKNILLIGGLGFIGSCFVNLFRTKYNFQILDTNYFQQTMDNDIQTTIKDIRNIELNDFRNIDFVVHMGELSNDPLGEFDKCVTKKINQEGTKKIFEMAQKSNIKKFIYMSSASIYGFSKEIMYETSLPNPLSEYAISKVENENFILKNTFPFETIILRNATAFGYSTNLRLDLVVNDLTFDGYFNKQIKLISDGQPKRPIVHIYDISNAIDMIISDERNLDKEIFNIGSNNMNFSIKQIAETIGNTLNLENISFGEFDSDQRSYEVNFDKFTKYFPNFSITYDLKNGVEHLVAHLAGYELNGNEKRINSIKELVSDGKLNSELFWND